MCSSNKEIFTAIWHSFVAHSYSFGKYNYRLSLLTKVTVVERTILSERYQNRSIYPLSPRVAELNSPILQKYRAADRSTSKPYWSLIIPLMSFLLYSGLFKQNSSKSWRGRITRSPLNVKPFHFKILEPWNENILRLRFRVLEKHTRQLRICDGDPVEIRKVLDNRVIDHKPRETPDKLILLISLLINVALIGQFSFRSYKNID